MKDEIPNATIKKHVVIKLSHCYETVNGEIEKNLKCLAKEINENQIDVDDYRNSVLANTCEIYASKKVDCIKMSDLYRFFHPLSLDAICKTLGDKECITINKFCLKRRSYIFHYECFGKIE